MDEQAVWNFGRACFEKQIAEEDEILVWGIFVGGKMSDGLPDLWACCFYYFSLFWEMRSENSGGRKPSM